MGDFVPLVNDFKRAYDTANQKLDKLEVQLGKLYPESNQLFELCKRIHAARERIDVLQMNIQYIDDAQNRLLDAINNDLSTSAKMITKACRQNHVQFPSISMPTIEQEEEEIEPAQAEPEASPIKKPAERKIPKKVARRPL